MRRAILFLIFALFLAMVIQPNLNKQIKEKSKIDVPEQTNSTIITNDTVDNSRCKSKAVICIDASHGGSDAGYTSDGHTSEKDLNLIIAKKIGDSLLRWDITSCIQEVMTLLFLQKIALLQSTRKRQSI